MSAIQRSAVKSTMEMKMKHARIDEVAVHPRFFVECCPLRFSDILRSKLKPGILLPYHVPVIARGSSWSESESSSKPALSSCKEYSDMTGAGI